MVSRPKLRVIFLLYLVYAQLLTSQNPIFELVNFTADDGLSQNSVYDITQTDDGFMWYGTNDGLNRFDGAHFEHFKVKTGDGVTRSNVIFSLLNYSKGILIGTNEEILYFDPVTGVFLPVSKVLNGLILPNKIGINKLFWDSAGILWILTIDHGIYKYDQKKKMVEQFLESNETKSKVTSIAQLEGKIYVSTEDALYRFDESFRKLDISFLEGRLNMRNIKDVEGKLWLAINSLGILIYDPTSGKLENFNSMYIGGHFPKDVTHVINDKNTVWLGTRSNGLLKVDIKHHTFFNIRAGDKKNELKTDFVLNIFKDLQHQVWIGQSGGGVARISRDVSGFEIFRPIGSDRQDKEDPMILGILDGNDDTYYMGTLYGGLLYYDRIRKKHTYYTDPKLPVESKNIYGMTHQDNTIWLATWAGLCSFDKLSKTFHIYPDDIFGIGTQLYSVLKIENDTKLLVSGFKGLIVFDLKTKKWSKCFDTKNVLGHKKLVIRYMSERADGDVYMSGMEENFLIYNYKKGIFQFYPQLSKYGTSRCFDEDTKGNLWIASDNGLIQTNKTDFRIKKVWTKKDGLTNDFIYAVAMDDAHFIWISTNKGLSKIDPITGSVSNFNKRDGLQDIEFNSAAVLRNKKGELVFGGINGINFVQPNNLIRKYHVSIPQLTNVKIMNKPFLSDTCFSAIRNITLEHTQNFVDIRFISPNSSSQDDIRYFYRLDGVDPKWVDAGERNFVSYTQLKPGNYQFFVKAIDRMGNESLPNEQLRVYIKTPYYATLWFNLFIISCFVSLIYAGVKYRINQLKRDAISEKTIAQLEMKALQSQMNPHFIFNCINGIYEMIISKENDNARAYLKDFATLMRMTLENSKKTLISLDQTINYLTKYLEIEKLRLTDFKYIISIAPDIDLTKSYFPPMILQPLVENSIWHGVAPLKGEKIVIIKIYQSDKKFVICEIDDNGIGINLLKAKNKNVNHLSTGIENIKEHIVLLNDKYQMDIRMIFFDKSELDQQNQGTLVKLTMKIDSYDF